VQPHDAACPFCGGVTLESRAMREQKAAELAPTLQTVRAFLEGRT
jgi:hypothetical protein